MKIVLIIAKKIIKRHKLLFYPLRYVYGIYIQAGSKIRKLLLRAKMIPAQIKLAYLKRDQVYTFYALRNIFPGIYHKLKKCEAPQFTTAFWDKNNAELEKTILPYPPFSFLRDPIISRTMFMTAGGKWLKEELKYLKKRMPAVNLKSALQEDYVGGPVLLNSKYLTSHNSIHHLYHLVRFLDKTQQDLDQMGSVVEWGGGYGNMAKIFRRLRSAPCTYVIIDTPLFSCLQWLYLASILGEGNVHLLQNSEDKIHAGKINLLPLHLLDCHELRADLFISTWALSESSKFSLEYILNHAWFNAKHLLLAYASDSFSDANKLGEEVMSEGVVTERIEFLPGRHYYTFR